MSQVGTGPPTTVGAGTSVTRALLAGGVAAGPLFVAVVFGQAAARVGFDFKWHPLSLLSLGRFGWIQVANFIVTGSLYLAAAVGMRRVLYPGRGGTWGPWLIGLFGAALVWAGVFLPDPYHGFPPGSPAGSDHVSWHGVLHSIAPPVAFLALSVACLVFTWRFAKLRQRGWTLLCVVVWLALGIPNLFFGRPWFALALALTAAVGWGWASAIAARVMTELKV